MDIPDMIEKTLRYPGTIEYLKVLRESGFFSHDPVDINGSMIKPVDLTSKLLFPLWKLKRGEADITVMRIVIKGDLNGYFTEVLYQLHDQHDPDNQISSMARTTGYTCTAVANLILDGAFHGAGIIAPEFVGKDQKKFEYILNYLDQRGVRYKMNTRKISGNLQ
jgi:saccharopine dehydrogenase-like NADP-dependent oxidoreductase